MDFLIIFCYFAERINADFILFLFGASHFIIIDQFIRLLPRLLLPLQD
jgi:hypothetical protein